MYTGIVQACLPIVSVERKPGLMTFAIDLPEVLLDDLVPGASVSINGVCFTATRIDGARVTFDAVAETLAISNIKHLETGTMVNVERSAKSDAEVGGHILSGHVMDVARVAAVKNSENNCRMTFAAQGQWLKYVFDKGFLAINGASLTIAELDRDSGHFSINLIPETLQRTNFSLLGEGDEVNIEIESQTQVIVDTVERVMADRFAGSAA